MSLSHRRVTAQKLAEFAQNLFVYFYIYYGQKLFLGETIVKNQCLNFVLISTDIGCVLSPW